MAKIFVVEDNAQTREIYQKKLELEKFEVLTAANGQECLQLLETEKPDLIMMDMMMPKINGPEAIRKIRTDSRFSQIPILVLSARDQADVIHKVLELGADDYLIKARAKLNEVIEKIRILLKRGRPASKQPAPKENTSLPQIQMNPNHNQILVIEDNELSREIYREKLEEENFQVHTVSTGEEGLEFLQYVKPDLIIMDLILPQMNGFEVIWKIRSDPRLSQIPILVVSVRNQDTEMKKALNIGANDYLVKRESNPQEVIAKIKALLAPRSENRSSYRVEIIETVLDAPQLARDLGLNPSYRCPKCNNPLVLNLFPQGKNGNHRLSGSFICPRCQPAS